MSAELERRLDLLTGELRDLVRWLKEDQSQRLTTIEQGLAAHHREIAGTTADIATLRIDVHDHGNRITALEAAKRPRRKARK